MQMITPLPATTTLHPGDRLWIPVVVQDYADDGSILVVQLQPDLQVLHPNQALVQRADCFTAATQVQQDLAANPAPH